MKREIKFRAWVTNRDGVTYSNGSHMEYDITIVNGKYADVECGWDIHGTYPYHLMQFTGLKDKNGVEVFEGDVIESTILGVKFRGEVFWETAGWRVKGDDLDITLGNDKEKTRKVIGNIHENPELIK